MAHRLAVSSASRRELVSSLVLLGTLRLGLLVGVLVLAEITVGFHPATHPVNRSGGRWDHRTLC
jgi:hypothetical protein